MSVIENYPALRPTLLLDFANSRRVHPLIQCLRASTATCYGPDGKLRIVESHVPRLDFDPITGKCLGFRIEEQRTNILINSVMAGAASGTPGTAPTNYGFGVGNGTTEVTSMGTFFVLRMKTATAARHFITQTNMPVEVGQYCLSTDCYFYIASRIIDAITVLMGTAVATLRYFIDGVEVTTNTQVGVGRRKLAVVMDVTAAGTIAPRFGVGVSTAVVGDVEMSLPQLEVGGFPTSFIPTNAWAVTRAADLPTLDMALPTVGAFISTVADLSSASTSNAYVWSAINPADHGSDHAYLYYPGASQSVNWWVNKGAVGQSGGNVLGRRLSAGFSFDASARTAAIAAGSLLTQDDSTRPRDFPANLSQLLLGRSRANTGFLNGCISRLAFYSGRITNAQLQRLTA